MSTKWSEMKKSLLILLILELLSLKVAAREIVTDRWGRHRKPKGKSKSGSNGKGRSKESSSSGKGRGKESRSSDRAKMLILTVTNLSYQQPFSGFFVMVHNEYAAPLYAGGEPATPELGTLAEDGDPNPLVALYADDENVCMATTAPGPTGGNLEGVPNRRDIMVTVNERCPLITIATMAIHTNDCFVAINGDQLMPGDIKFFPGLDAGTEENNELCSSIPGPACGDSGNVRSLNGEGFVHVHRGFHGIGNGTDGERFLSQQGYDWRNPMMRVNVHEYVP